MLLKHQRDTGLLQPVYNWISLLSKTGLSLDANSKSVNYIYYTTVGCGAISALHGDSCIILYYNVMIVFGLLAGKNVAAVTTV